MGPDLKQGIVKLDAITAATTTGLGLGTFFNYLPSMLGIIATMSGITLTWVMICKGRLNIQKVKLENEVLKSKLLKKEHAHE